MLVLELRNEPGAFAAVAQKLADEHINISYAYVTAGASHGRTSAVFKVAVMKKAKKVLESIHGKEKSQSSAIRNPPGRRR